MHGMRYVDDVFVLSKSVCSSCLTTVVDTMYGTHIKFDYQPDSFRQCGDHMLCKWVDAEWIVSWTKQGTIHSNPNELFALSGRLQDKRKFRGLPWHTGFSAEQYRDAYAELAGRKSRWLQLQLSEASTLYAVAIDILELQAMGFPLVVIKRLWRKQKSTDYVWMLARRVLQAWPWLEHPCQQDTCLHGVHVCTEHQACMFPWTQQLLQFLAGLAGAADKAAAVQCLQMSCTLARTSSKGEEPQAGPSPTGISSYPAGGLCGCT
eukprot:15485120-Alexandrium_andersonii.AAC.1